MFGRTSDAAEVAVTRLLTLDIHADAFAGTCCPGSNET